jgi:hypothetical protein
MMIDVKEKEHVSFVPKNIFPNCNKKAYIREYYNTFMVVPNACTWKT